MTKLRFTWTWDSTRSNCRISGVDMGDGLAAGYEHQAGWYERQLIEEIERLRAICACAYQMAGAYDAPVRFLDALSLHDEYMQMAPEQIIDRLLLVESPVEPT